MSEIVPHQRPGGDMASIVPVHQEHGQLWADARTLHAALQVGRDFSTWVQARLAEVDATEGEDFIVLDNSPVSGSKRGGSNRRDYWLHIDLAKEMSMMERSEIGKQVRRHFIEAEKKLRLMLPQSYPEALRALAAAEENRLALAAENATLQPKAQAFDRLMDADGTYSVADAAKIIGRADLGPNRLFDLLRERGILYRNTEGHNVPYQQYLTRGYFTVRAGHRPSTSQGTMTTSTTRVTPKGLDWICRNVLKIPAPQPRLSFEVPA